MSKLLTVATPAYNAESCLRKCLDSFTCPAAAADLEVIVVDDGSTDGTRAAALAYSAAHPEVFRVISKRNGGHGSGINAAAAAASGAYFRVVDADDWVETQNLLAFLARLRTAREDVVLTHFRTVHMGDGAVREYKTGGVPLGTARTLAQMMDAPPAARACMTFHGICYRTAFYRDFGLVLPENLLYEDQEYATVPLAAAKSILPLDLFFYEYQIGNALQSVSDENQVRNIGMQEEIFWRIRAARPKDAGEAAGRYFDHKLSMVLLSYYTTALIKNRDRRGGLAAARRMLGRVKQEDPRLYAATLRHYAASRALHAAGCTGNTLNAMKRSALYQRVRRLMRT